MPQPVVGKLNRRVTLQRSVRRADALGQMVETWEDVAPVWAEIAPVSGGEQQSGRRTAADTNYRVTIRTYPGVAATGWRVLHGARVLEVKAALDLEGAGRFLQLDCVERA